MPCARKVLLSWSSGKDSAWALHVLRRIQDIEIVGLLTTFNEASDRVAMHGVRRELVELQAAAAGLPLFPVPLPWPCDNAVYEQTMETALRRVRQHGVTHLAFGDLFLDDIRRYRERQLSGLGIEPLFPLWCDSDATPGLVQEMLAAGIEAVVTCVDSRQLGAEFVGRPLDAQFLADLPPTVDPCGERGEFHTFCCAGPMFGEPIPVQVIGKLCSHGFWFADLTLASKHSTRDGRGTRPE